MKNSGEERRTRTTKSTTKMEGKIMSVVGGMMILKLEEKSFLENITKEAISLAYISGNQSYRSR